MSAQVQRFLVVLPLPSRMVSPNQRGHWAVKAKAFRQARRSAWYWFRRELPPGWRQRPVRLDVHYHCPAGAPGYCPRDAQNAIAALKPAIDGMVDAKVVPDDNAQWVSWGVFRLTRQGDLAAGVYVTVVAEAAAGAEEHAVGQGEEHGRAEALGEGAGDDEPSTAEGRGDHGETAGAAGWHGQANNDARGVGAGADVLRKGLTKKFTLP